MVQPDGVADEAAPADTETTDATTPFTKSIRSVAAAAVAAEAAVASPLSVLPAEKAAAAARVPLAGSGGDAKGYSFLFKYVLVGDSWCGKTALVRRVARDEFIPSKDNTIGVDFDIMTQQLDNGDQVKLQLWDTAGQERFRTITTSYYRGCQAIVIVFDVNKAPSYFSVKQWLQEVQRYCNEDTKIVIVGSKMDLADPSSGTFAGRESMLQEEWIQCQDNLLGVFEVSAKSGQGVHEAFDVITQALVNEKLDQRNPLRAKGGIKLGAQGGGGSKSGGQGKKKCC